MAEDLERRLREADARLRENLRSFDLEVEFQLSNEGERADLWTDIDVNVDDLRTVLDAMEELRAAHLAAHARGAERDQECFRLEDALATSRARVEALEKATTGWQPIASAPACDDFSIWFGWHKSQGLCQVSWGDNPRDMLFFRRIDHNDAEWKWTPSLSDFEAWMPLPVALTRQEEGNG